MKIIICTSLRIAVFNIAANGIGLGEEADLTAQKMIEVLMFDIAPKFHSSTETAFLPNPC